MNFITLALFAIVVLIVSEFVFKRALIRATIVAAILVATIFESYKTGFGVGSAAVPRGTAQIQSELELLKKTARTEKPEVIQRKINEASWKLPGNETMFWTHGGLYDPPADISYSYDILK